MSVSNLDETNSKIFKNHKKKKFTSLQRSKNYEKFIKLAGILLFFKSVYFTQYSFYERRVHI